MSKVGGKGRIPNRLVAASFAAVLTVYSAGYWRTRDEARRLDARAQERRPVRIEPVPGTDVATALESPAVPAAVPSAEPAATPPPSTLSSSASATEQPASGTKLLAAQGLLAERAGSGPPPLPEPSAPASERPAPSPGDSAPASAAPAAPASAATAESESAPLPDPASAPAGQWRDGTYTGWGTSRHGDIKAQVVIRNGRIVEAGIASCETRYPCDVIGHIIAQPVARQSPDVDHVSRATESADAYYYGLVEALKEAQLPADGDVAAAP